MVPPARACPAHGVGRGGGPVGPAIPGIRPAPGVAWGRRSPNPYLANFPSLTRAFLIFNCTEVGT